MGENKKPEKITLTVKELVEVTGLGQTTVYELVRGNEIPHKRVRGRILFHRPTIEKWFAGEEIEEKAL